MEVLFSYRAVHLLGGPALCVPFTSSACRRRCDIETQLLVGGVERNPGPRSHSTQPVTTLKVSAMTMDVDEYVGREHKAKHRVTYVDTDSPFLENRKPAQWNHRVNVTPKLKSPMSKFHSLLLRYEEAIHGHDITEAQAVAAQGKSLVQSYPNSIFAKIVSASDWNNLRRAVYNREDALDWCDYARGEYAAMRDELGLPPIEDTQSTITVAEYNQVADERDKLVSQVDEVTKEKSKMKQWWLTERETARSLESQLASANALLAAAQLERDRKAQECATLLEEAATQRAAFVEREVAQCAALREEAAAQFRAFLEIAAAQAEALGKEAAAQCTALREAATAERLKASAAAAGQAATIDQLKNKLNKAHEALFSREAQIMSMQTELGHVRDQLRDARTRLHEALVSQRTPPAATSTAANPFGTTHTQPPQEVRWGATGFTATPVCTGTPSLPPPSASATPFADRFGGHRLS